MGRRSTYLCVKFYDWNKMSVYSVMKNKIVAQVSSPRDLFDMFPPSHYRTTRRPDGMYVIRWNGRIFYTAK